MTRFALYNKSLSMQNFYISCPLGLENIAWEEVKHKWELFLSSSPPTPIFFQGGMELNCELHDGLAINLFSKTSNKVLLRIKKQKCRDIPKLFNIISKIKWKDYLKREDLNWNITCHESRLFNTKKIEKACRDGLEKYFNANKLPQKIKEQKNEFHKQNIFLRFDNDTLTISIDTSGELLHIRGEDKFRGHASIRSTIATCLLWMLGKGQSNHNLVDPMCGTGTFLKEALYFYDHSKRKFPFFDWYPEQICLNKVNPSINYNKLIGYDIDGNIISKNSKQTNEIDYKVKNIFNDQYRKLENTIVICNPPYGKRVKLDRPREQYFQDLIDTIEKKLNPQKIGIILPLDIKLKQKSKKYRVFNSGIWLNYHII